MVYKSIPGNVIINNQIWLICEQGASSNHLCFSPIHFRVVEIETAPIAVAPSRWTSSGFCQNDHSTEQQCRSQDPHGDGGDESLQKRKRERERKVTTKGGDEKS